MTAPARGFTLIELLVVLVIVGVVLTFATLSINPTGPGDRLDTESQRLVALTQAAADDAVLYGNQIGLQIMPGGYRFLTLGPKGWQVITATDSPLHPRSLEDDLHLTPMGNDRSGNGGGTVTLSLPPSTSPEPDDNGNSGDAQGRNDSGNRRQLRRPDALFLSSGEILPFTLQLSADDVDHRFNIIGEPNGDITLKRVARR